MAEEYFLVMCDEDGEVTFKRYDKEELESDLDEEYYGPLDFYVPDDSFGVEWQDPQYWKKAIVIKGTIVVPEKVEVARKYKL